MILPTLVVSGCFPQARLRADWEALRPTHAVSLAGRTDGADGAWACGFLAQHTPVHVTVPCDDLDEPLDGYRPPQVSDIDLLFGVGQQLAPTDRLLVHCHAGLSRSPAAAIALGVAYLRAHTPLTLDHAQRVALWVRRAQPLAMPNARFLSLLLDRLDARERAGLEPAFACFQG